MRSDLSTLTMRVKFTCTVLSYLTPTRSVRELSVSTPLRSKQHSTSFPWRSPMWLSCCLEWMRNHGKEKETTQVPDFPCFHYTSSLQTAQTYKCRNQSSCFFVCALSLGWCLTTLGLWTPIEVLKSRINFYLLHHSIKDWITNGLSTRKIWYSEHWTIINFENFK